MIRAGLPAPRSQARHPGIRHLVRGCCRQILRHSARKLGARQLARSAIVFSPHFDDETLGCGGTVLKKRRLGAHVTIVFMTDGSKSHAQFVSADTLREIRRREAFAAAHALGVAAQDVLLLDFEETKLQAHAHAASRRVEEILRTEQPQDVFLPYHREPPADHVATNKIVWSALKGYGKEATVYEYPIWFWLQWPWAAPRDSAAGRLRKAATECIGSSIRLAAECRWHVCIADVAREKRFALEQYKSQMTRLNSDPRWPILGDVASGDFLECFSQKHEVFSKRVSRDKQQIGSPLRRRKRPGPNWL